MVEEKKSIGIVTIFDVSNFGAELQTYATQKAMQNMGYDAEIIDFPYYKSPSFKREAVANPFYPYPLKLRLKEMLSGCLRWVRQLTSHKKLDERAHKFKRFHQENTRFSKEKYNRISSLYKNPPSYDVYCVGSDQVWNPYNFVSLYPYFLTFASEGSRKMSYASSFGVSTIPSAAQSVFGACLNGFDAISVREESGARMVEELSQKRATVVCDPTLLLDKNDWEQVERGVAEIPERFVLVYELHPIPYLNMVAAHVSKLLGIPVVRICSESMATHPGCVNLFNIGPAEFVYLFRHATFVVTNSFHGTCFSLNFRKNFYCVLSPTQNNNSRQLSILNHCNLVSRVLYVGDDLPSLSALPVLYDKADEAIEDLRRISVKFIRTAVDGKD
ncbi:MAG: polysaccharide pyruvyl transferase family protein [Alloprevotella sp.]|nr:polysaccharide pyruvyl transferase family protein [Alloprevotella sp.]